MLLYLLTLLRYKYKRLFLFSTKEFRINILALTLKTSLLFYYLLKKVLLLYILYKY